MPSRSAKRVALAIEAACPGGAAGALEIAAVPSVAAHIFPQILTAMLREHPGIRIELFDTESARLLRLVVVGDAELEVAGRPPAPNALCFVPLFHGPFRLACRKDHPLAALGQPLE